MKKILSPMVVAVASFTGIVAAPVASTLAPAIAFAAPTVLVADMSVAEFETGVLVSASELPADSDIFTIAIALDEVGVIAESEAAADDGAFSHVIHTGRSGADALGTYTALVADARGTTSFETTFEVTAGAPGERSASPSTSPSSTARASAPAETPTATPSATPAVTPTSSTAERRVPAAADSDDPVPVDYAYSIADDTVTQEEFVDRDKGVQFSVVGLDPGEEIVVRAAPRDGNIDSYTLTALGDEGGVGTFSIYGTNTMNPSAYVGAYDFTITNNSGEELSGSFQVIGSAEPAGAGSDQKGETEASEIPRTGTELTGLAAGAALLVLGAATLVITRHRGAKNSAPQDL